MPFGSTLQTALESEVVSLFYAVEVVHPIKTFRLLDGDAQLSFGGHTWVGIDDDIGALGALESIDDQTEQDQAPEYQLIIRPADASLLIGLTDPAAQGGRATVYEGAFNPATGVVVGDPEAVFYGEIDAIDMLLDGPNSTVTFLLTSHFNRFQMDDEAMTLSDSFHQSVWPGELGLEFMTEVEQQMPWGAEGQRPEVIAVQTVMNNIFGRGR